jgi:hypothetical protein
MSAEKEPAHQPDRAELLRRRQEADERRLAQRQNLRGPGGKRHRHDAAASHFRLRSGRKG